MDAPVALRMMNRTFISVRDTKYGVVAATVLLRFNRRPARLLLLHVNI